MSEKRSLEESVELLTLGETMAIEGHFGKSIDGGMSAIELTAGVIWAFERRNDLKGTSGKRTDWHDIEAMKLRDLKTYFADEEIDIDPDDPETEQGKDDSLGG